MLDLWDHGKILMVLEGQFLKVEEFEMSIERDRATTATFGKSRVVPMSQKISIRVVTSSKFVSNRAIPRGITRLYNQKHRIDFTKPYICSVTRYEDSTEIEFSAEDYDVTVNWK